MMINMRREKRLKPIEVDPDTYKLMCKIWAPHKVPYNPTIKEKGGDKQDGEPTEHEN